MIKKINIFNYEAYYLDYLEGNISEEDAAVLLDFLDKHPELKMEDEELPVFKEVEVSLCSLDFLKETVDTDPSKEKIKKASSLRPFIQIVFQSTL